MNVWAWKIILQSRCHLLVNTIILYPVCGTHTYRNLFQTKKVISSKICMFTPGWSGQLQLGLLCVKTGRNIAHAAGASNVLTRMNIRTWVGPNPPTSCRTSSNSAIVLVSNACVHVIWILNLRLSLLPMYWFYIMYAFDPMGKQCLISPSALLKVIFRSSIEQWLIY